MWMRVKNGIHHKGRPLLEIFPPFSVFGLVSRLLSLTSHLKEIACTCKQSLNVFQLKREQIRLPILSYLRQYSAEPSNDYSRYENWTSKGADGKANTKNVALKEDN